MDKKLELSEALYRRQSTRAYDMSGLSKEELTEIIEYAKGLENLIDGKKFKAEVLGADDVKSIMKWRAPHYLAIYSDDSDEGIMNAAYIYEQVVIYLTSRGIGTCWATSVSPKEKHEEDGTKWCAVIAFGKPESGDGWRNPSDVKRKRFSDISDRADEKLEAARIAPSSMNNQPWFFEHDGDYINIFCKKQGFMKKWMTSQNRVDMGIALGNLKVANPEMRFDDKATASKDGYTFMGRISF